MTQDDFDPQKYSSEEGLADEIEPGMDVDVTAGDLGETDITKPKVTDIVRDEQGNVEDIVVNKGLIFKKKLEVPADRVKAVDPETQEDNAAGKVVISTTPEELDSLRAIGEEELAPEKQSGLLDEVERRVPTAEGVREMETLNLISRIKREYAHWTGKETGEASATQQPVSSQQQSHRGGFVRWLKMIGPGFLSGMAGNDATAVTTYAIAGATAGYSYLWLMLLSTPMYQAVQYSCARIGRMTHMGLSHVLRVYYGHWMAVLASLVLIVANIALITGNLVAIGSGLELITGISWVWFVLPAAAMLWYITVYRDFETIKKIFIVMSLAFVVYMITALFSGANWGSVLFRTFVPQLQFNLTSVAAAVALLGATISPYSMYWQVQGEREQHREGTLKQKLRSAAADVATGTTGGNLVSYFIIVTTAAALYTHHKSIQSAADAAQALVPLLGPFAKYLFAIGLIGAGLIAIPILLASTSYSVAGTFGWPEGLSKKPWQSEGFYLILSGVLVASLVLILLRLNPIQLIFYANVLVGVLAPVLVIYILVVGNNRKIMGDHPLGFITNFFLVLTAFVMIAAAFLLFYGLFTGQG